MARKFLTLGIIVITVSLVAATIRGDSADPQVVSGEASALSLVE